MSTRNAERERELDSDTVAVMEADQDDPKEKSFEVVEKFADNLNDHGTIGEWALRDLSESFDEQTEPRTPVWDLKLPVNKTKELAQALTESFQDATSDWDSDTVSEAAAVVAQTMTHASADNVVARLEAGKDADNPRDPETHFELMDAQARASVTEIDALTDRLANALEGDRMTQLAATLMLVRREGEKARDAARESEINIGVGGETGRELQQEADTIQARRAITVTEEFGADLRSRMPEQYAGPMPPDISTMEADPAVRDAVVEALREENKGDYRLITDQIARRSAGADDNGAAESGATLERWVNEAISRDITAAVGRTMDAIQSGTTWPENDRAAIEQTAATLTDRFSQEREVLNQDELKEVARLVGDSLAASGQQALDAAANDTRLTNPIEPENFARLMQAARDGLSEQIAEDTPGLARALEDGTTAEIADALRDIAQTPDSYRNMAHDGDTRGTGWISDEHSAVAGERTGMLTAMFEERIAGARGAEREPVTIEQILEDPTVAEELDRMVTDTGLRPADMDRILARAGLNQAEGEGEQGLEARVTGGRYAIRAKRILRQERAS